MFAPVRFWATVVYLAMLAITLALSILVRTLLIMIFLADQSLTFFSPSQLHNFILSIILVIVQFCALVWYA
jgi:hypothetical protein